MARVDALPHGESGSVAADQSASIGVEKDVKDNPPLSSKKGEEVQKSAGCKKRKKAKDLIDYAKDSMRESEIAIDEAFKDKIVCRDGNSYNCRCCPLFVTSVKLLAMSHAQSYGEKKKLGRRTKVLKCDECGD